MRIRFWRFAAFWLAAVSLAVCLGDWLGSGSANIVLVRFNPLVAAMTFTDPFSGWIVDGEATRMETNSYLIHLRYTAYWIHFGSFAVAGALIDAAIAVAAARIRLRRA